MLERLSIKARVTVSATAILVVVVLTLAIFSGRLLRADTERLIGEQQVSMIKLIAAQVDERVEDRFRALTTIASGISGELLSDPQKVQAWLEKREVVTRLFNRGGFVIDHSGFAIASVPKELDRVGKRYGEGDAFERIMAGAKSAVLRPLIVQSSGTPVFAMAVPIMSAAGEIIGILYGVTDLSRPNFLDVVASNRVGTTGGFFVIDQKSRRILSATDKSRVMEELPKPGVSQAIDAFAAKDEQSVVLVNAKGAEVLSSIKSVPSAGWQLVASLPTVELDAPIRKTRQRLVLTSLLLTMLAGALTWWTIRRELSPVQEAAMRLDAAADGGAQPLVVERPDEVGELFAAFNRQLAALRSREDALAKTSRLARIGGWEIILATDTRIWSDETLRILEIDPLISPKSPEEAMRYYPPSGRARMQEAIRIAIEHGTGWDMEMQMITAKGRPIWVRNQGIAEQVDGVTTKLVGTLHDIAERKEVETQLFAQRALAENILSNMGQGVGVTDAEGRFEYINPAYGKLLGWAPHEFIGKTIGDITPAEETEFVNSQRELRRAGVTSTYLTRLVRRDGSVVSVSVTASPRSIDGQFNGTIAVVTDLTERNAMEQALKDQRDFAESVINSMEQGVGVSDRAGRFEFVNVAYARLLGYDPAALVGRDLADFLPEDDKPTLHNQLEQRRAGRAASYESRRIRSDGRVVSVLVSASPRYVNGENVGAIAVLTDLTEQREAERALVESDLRFRSLMEDISSIAVQSYTVDGAVVFWNRTSERLYGFTAAEAIGKNLIDLVIPVERRVEVVDALADIERTGSVQSAGEYVMQRKDGSKVPVYSTHALTKRDGRVHELFCLDIDLTDQKRAEEMREVLEERLRQSQKMEAIGTLAGGIAHDFNNILATILGNVELAQHVATLDPDVKVSLVEIRKAGTRARDLVGQILSFSRRQATTFRSLDLVEIVNESARLLRTTLPGNITLLVECAPQVPPVIGDNTQLQQVLMNLATNAMQAIGATKGGISIGLDTVIQTDDLLREEPRLRELIWTQGKIVRLTIADTGPGMDEATIKRVFEPFFTTKAVNEGTGLGLAVVHGIVMGHGAVINVVSAVGRGTVFTVYFSATQEPPVNVATSLKDADDMVSNRASLPAVVRPHILYLDDDEAIVFLVTRLLQRRGFQVSAFTNQQLALEALRAAPRSFALLVTDYNMPGMSGLDVAREARAIRNDLPIAVASGFVDEKLQTMAAEAGVREVIFKANVTEEFCDIVERLVRRDPP